MRLAVSGATGFLGSHVLVEARAAGHEAVGISRGQDPQALLEGLHDARPDAVIHLASRSLAQPEFGEIPGMIAAELELGILLAEAAKELDAVFVAAGSFWQFGPSSETIGSGGPNTLYAALKSALHEILSYESSHGLPAAVLVLHDLYGPHLESNPRQRLIPTLLAAARSGEPLDLTKGHQVLDPVWTPDAARAFLQAANILRRGELVPDRLHHFAVRGGEPLSVRELAGLVERVSGRTLHARWGALPTPPWTVAAPWDGPALPGWLPQVSLEQGLRRLWEAWA